MLVKYVRPSSTEGKAPYVWTLATIQKLICQNYRDVNYLIECYWLCAPILTFERYFSFLIIQGHFQIYTVHQCKWDLITAKCWYFYLFLQEQQDKTTPLPGVLFFIFIFSKRPMGKWWSFAATWCLWERWWWWPLDDFFLILKWRKWPHQWITAMVELVTQMCFPTNDDNKNDSSWWHPRLQPCLEWLTFSSWVFCISFKMWNLNLLYSDASSSYFAGTWQNIGHVSTIH